MNPRTLEPSNLEISKQRKKTNNMKKYKKLIIATIIALIFIGTFVFLWQKSQPKEIVYNEFTPEMNEVKKTTIITGKIEPRNEVNIKPQIGGIITDLYKEPGDYVQAGEVIAKVKVIPDMGQAQFCGEPCASCQSEPQTGTGGL